eukprot:GFKZ01011153.1.p1 GENE.GFKZ01011153.1~~GFKZ01011153.1.p1  ORF type:complete len:333 (+),score=48.35 GFKZ01011153.1:78-1076(+)
MGATDSRPTDDISAKILSDPTLHPSAFPRSEGRTLKLTTTNNSPRRIGYEIYGNEDVDASSTVLFFHGTPGTRFFFSKNHSEIAKRHGIRVVVPERPGFGLSDPMMGRTLMDGAEDAKQVLESLGVESVYVIGYSAGGPYALAFGKQYQENCLGVAIVAGLSPNVSGVMSGVPLGLKLGYWMSANAPWALRWGVQRMVHVARREMLHGKVSEFVESENECLRNDEDVRRVFVEGTMELYSRECGVRAEVEDYSLMARDWEFKLEDVGGKVILYGGGRDTKCGIGMFKELERGLTEGGGQVLVRFEEEEDHLIFYRVFEQVLVDLGAVEERRV